MTPINILLNLKKALEYGVGDYGKNDYAILLVKQNCTNYTKFLSDFNDIEKFECKTWLPKKGEVVTTISHPKGKPRRYSIPNEIISNTDSKLELKYILNTYKGSSGAPIFNSMGEIIAVHNASNGYKITNVNDLIDYGYLLTPAIFKNCK